MNRLGFAGYLVMNPTLGDFVVQENLDQWIESVTPHMTTASHIRPAFQITHDDDLENLASFLDGTHGREVGVIVRGAGVSPTELSAIRSGRLATVFLHKSSNPRSHLRVLPSNRAVVVEECFTEQARNADYSGEEWFTSSNLEFRREGRPGFSDFGPLPPFPKLGGGQIAAAAIHLTFKYIDGSIWIEHFISDSTERGDGNSTSKMREATARIYEEAMNNPDRFIANLGLRQFLNQHEEGRPTSLGTSKQQQLVHHMVTAAECIPD